MVLIIMIQLKEIFKLNKSNENLSFWIENLINKLNKIHNNTNEIILVKSKICLLISCFSINHWNEFNNHFKIILLNYIINGLKCHYSIIKSSSSKASGILLKYKILNDNNNNINYYEIIVSLLINIINNCIKKFENNKKLSSEQFNLFF